METKLKAAEYVKQEVGFGCTLCQYIQHRKRFLRKDSYHCLKLNCRVKPGHVCKYHVNQLDISCFVWPLSKT